MVQVFYLFDARTRTRTVSLMRTHVSFPSAISRLMVVTETQVCSAACPMSTGSYLPRQSHEHSISVGQFAGV